ncbi:hypothetical protein GIB67_013234 [Kingdonia uniflora]|uniref:BHLH domain-containing protein n=1 Tax=Kingdonia uniflora TaxID=39325 RepID=A0A7J7NSX3_9MAGN|nr:hypothetical protein GIB67_013234 [Kingdonia uniflora]
MEEFLGGFFPASSWLDTERSSWVGNETNRLLSESGGVDEKNKQGHSNYGLDNILLAQEGTQGHSDLQLNTTILGNLAGFGSPSNSSFPQSWPSLSYGDVSSLSSVTEQDKLNGDYLDIDGNTLGMTSAGGDEVLQIKNFAASASINGQDEMHDHFLSSFAAEAHVTSGLQSQAQLSQFNEGNSLKNYTNQSAHSLLQCGPSIAGGGCNGAGKPRARARRGQATDPHSIAERLRREKIAERMKNLQELVPNSNKTDKASMLDEIIEYVKFLQLQVKVLSMSRLGAAGAVVPLITENQIEGSNGPLLLPSTGYRATHAETSDDIAFEQEVVKLMESSISKAMQFLQTKGLCLMPTALATAISGTMPSSASVSTQRNKMGFGSPQMSSSSELTRLAGAPFRPPPARKQLVANLLVTTITGQILSRMRITPVQSADMNYVPTDNQAYEKREREAPEDTSTSAANIYR